MSVIPQARNRGNCIMVSYHSDDANNVQTSDATERGFLLAARSNLHTFLSLVFADPVSTRFQLLCRPENRDKFLSSFRLLEDIAGERCESNPFLLAGEILDFIEKKADEIQDEWIRVFGHIPSRDTSCYELEHRLNQDVFATTQSLADIQGFYHAFGLVAESGERADHVSVEAEFLAFLLLKQAGAAESGQSDHEEVCGEAIRDFQNDHFLPWVEHLGSILSTHPVARFYRIVGSFVNALVEYEHFFAPTRTQRSL